MQNLINDQKQIPGGFRFRQQEIKWDSTKVLGLHPSLDVLTRAVISARKANPHYIEKYKWSTDFNAVRAEVKAFQVKICQSMGWQSYLTDGGNAAPPFSVAQSQENAKQISVAAATVKKLWAGIKTLNEWLDSGEPPVDQALAEQRAAVCVACPMNGKGDFTTWFTMPAAATIKRQLERLTERNISTSQDDKLQVCTACLCPLRLKAVTPMKFIQPHLSQEVIQELKKGRNCWIISELGA